MNIGDRILSFVSEEEFEIVDFFYDKKYKYKYYIIENVNTKARYILNEDNIKVSFRRKK